MFCCVMSVLCHTVVCDTVVCCVYELDYNAGWDSTTIDLALFALLRS